MGEQETGNRSISSQLANNFDYCSAKSPEKMEPSSSYANDQAINPAAEPNSQRNEPHPLVFVFFAFFGVNLDCSIQDKRPLGGQRADQLQKAIRCCQTAARATPSAGHFHVRFHCPHPYSLSLQVCSAVGDAMRMAAASCRARAHDDDLRCVAASNSDYGLVNPRRVRTQGQIGFTTAGFVGIVGFMSYQTVEVELENGRVQPCGAEALPARAHALLTILEGRPGKPAGAPTRTLGQAMRELGVLGRGDFVDLSTNKAHLDDFGK